MSSTTIVDEIKNFYVHLRNQSTNVENQINALTTKEEVVSFDLPNVE